VWHRLQADISGKVFADEAAGLYERATTTVLKNCTLLYFAYADFEEVWQILVVSALGQFVSGLKYVRKFLMNGSLLWLICQFVNSPFLETDPVTEIVFIFCTAGPVKVGKSSFHLQASSGYTRS